MHDGTLQEGAWPPASETHARIDPGAVVGVRVHGRSDELDAASAVCDRRHQQRPWIRSPLGPPRPDLLGEIAIQIGKAFEIALGMARRDARGTRRSRTEAGPAAR